MRLIDFVRMLCSGRLFDSKIAPTMDKEEEEGVALAPTVWNTIGIDDGLYK